MEQTQFGGSVAFSMRTFRFKNEGAAADEQEQTITCTLRLEPSEEISQDQAPDCTCYTEEECQSEYYKSIHKTRECFSFSR